MSVRLTMSVSGKVRWINLSSSRLIPKAIDKIVTMAQELNRIYVPKGTTGKLQGSFRVERSDRSVEFYWDAPYAKYVDNGTGESTGRYVPAIRKRLTGKTAISKLKKGIEELARGQYAWMEHPEKHIKAMKKVKVEYRELPGEYGSYSAERGGIWLDPNISRKKMTETAKHELWHVVQFGKEKQTFNTSETSYFGHYEAWARKIGKHYINIGRSPFGAPQLGTHPGIDGVHFSKSIIDLLKPYTTLFILNELRGASA